MENLLGNDSKNVQNEEAFSDRYHLLIFQPCPPSLEIFVVVSSVSWMSMLVTVVSKRGFREETSDDGLFSWTMVVFFLYELNLTNSNPRDLLCIFKPKLYRNASEIRYKLHFSVSSS